MKNELFLTLENNSDLCWHKAVISWSERTKFTWFPGGLLIAKILKQLSAKTQPLQSTVSCSKARMDFNNELKFKFLHHLYMVKV